MLHQQFSKNVINVLFIDIPKLNSFVHCFFFSLIIIYFLLYIQVPDNYTPPAPITAPVMRFPVEAAQPHDNTQVPPGAPQEPSVQVGV